MEAQKAHRAAGVRDPHRRATHGHWDKKHRLTQESTRAPLTPPTTSLPQCLTFTLSHMLMASAEMKGEQEAAAAASFGRVTLRLPQGRITLACHWSFPGKAPHPTSPIFRRILHDGNLVQSLTLGISFQHRISRSQVWHRN